MELTLSNVDKYINQKKILTDINFSISNGETVGLIGPNGAGKTTLLRMLATLYKPNNGTVTYNQRDIFVTVNNFRSTIGYLPEDSGLYNKLSALENLSFYTSFFNNITEKSILQMFKEFEIDPTKKVGTFSRGTKQKLLFIKSIIHNPDILILDEPFNVLDPSARIKMKISLKSFQETKKIIIFSSHILSDLEQLCDRFIFLKEGKIILDIKKTLNDSFESLNLEALYSEIMK